MRLFYAYGRGSDPGLKATKEWIWEVLFHRAYANGTRYYHQPDVYLYFFARLLAENPGSDLHRGGAGRRLLAMRLSERVHTAADPMGLAMRVLACQLTGLGSQVKGDLEQLLVVQEADGSFGVGWLCQYGKTGIKLGHRGLTTALAIKAVEAMRELPSPDLWKAPVAAAKFSSTEKQDITAPTLIVSGISAEPLPVMAA